MEARQQRRRAGYMIAGGVMMGFGVLAILSIGLPFLVVGLLVLVGGATDAPGRRPRLFWPACAVVVGFFVGFAVVAPMWCHRQATAIEEDQAGQRVASEGTTTCRSLVGVEYTGDLAYDPPLWTGLLAGVGAAAVAGAGTHRRIR